MIHVQVLRTKFMNQRASGPEVKLEATLHMSGSIPAKFGKMPETPTGIFQNLTGRYSGNVGKLFRDCLVPRVGFGL